ncbi:hypothetical protein SpCBS45565_g06135 [Spizellomyces sp. 'palustris']|nr:hypothetical protein SpCBS45565_g06135 [Spizellomyces sp. 'palustris']
MATEDFRLLQRPRPYQIELYQQALHRNIIAYLDTGSGKTLVSVLLLQNYASDLVEIGNDALIDLIDARLDTGNGLGIPVTTASKSNVARRSASGLITQEAASKDMLNPGTGTGTVVQSPLAVDVSPEVLLPAQPKKVIFLVPTVPLVSQQAAKIRANTDLIVGEYSRDDISSVAYWDAIGWYHELSKRHVLVLTPQIFLNILRHGFMKMSRDVSLLIIDECHHAVKHHPYNVLMKEFYHTIYPPESRPKVFGMTASPIYQKAHTHQDSLLRLQELQTNIDCVVVTVADRKSLHAYVPNASESLVEYAPPSGDTSNTRLSNTGAEGTPSARYYAHYLDRLRDLCQNFASKQKHEAAEKMGRNMEQIQAMEEELGPWLAGRAAEDLVRGMNSSRGYLSGHGKKARNQDILEPTKAADPRSYSELEYAPSLCQVTSSDVTPKVMTLLRLIEERAHPNSTEDNCGSDFRAMIFVERRFTAKVLSVFLNLVAQVRFPILKSSYVTGHGAQSTSGEPGSRSSMTSAYQRKAFDRFRAGDVNTLVVTRVAEEGVDIPACRLVIVFDMFRSHTGYVQSRGRARDLAGSEFIIMVRRNNMQGLRTVARAKVAEIMTRSVAKEMLGRSPSEAGSSSDSRDQVLRSEDDNDTTELLLGAQDVPLMSKAGASISALGAPQLLHRYCQAVSKDGKVDLSAFYSVILEPSSAEAWRTYSGNGEASLSPDDSIPFGYAVQFQFPDGTALAGDVISGHLRGTRKLAQQSVALEACRRLYSIGALNEHLLPNINYKTKPGAFSLPGILKRWQTHHNREVQDLAYEYAGKSLEANLQKEDVLQEYKRGVSSAFQKNDSWSHLEETDLPSAATATSWLYVTILSFGPELESFARGQEPPVDAFRGLLHKGDDVDASSTTLSDSCKSPACDQHLCRRAEHRRTLAILTSKPLPVTSIPSFPVWFDGEGSSTVEFISWNPLSSATNHGKSTPLHVTGEKDGSDGTSTSSVHSGAEPVPFNNEDLALARNFQNKFWDMVLRRPPADTVAVPVPQVLGKRKRHPADGDSRAVTSALGSGLPARRDSDETGVPPPIQGGGDVSKRRTVTVPSQLAGSHQPDAIVADGESVAFDADPRMYMVLPMRGIPYYSGDSLDIERASGQTRTAVMGAEVQSASSTETSLQSYAWEPDWDTVRRVVEQKPCTLYDWISCVGVVAEQRSGCKLPPGDYGVDNSSISNCRRVRQSASFLDRMSCIGNPAFDEFYDHACREIVEQSTYKPDDRGERTTKYGPDILREINQVLKQTVVCTTHNNIKYLPQELIPNLEPTAQFRKGRFGEVLTYKTYVEKLGYAVIHDQSAMVQATHSPSLRNHLKPRFIKRGVLTQAEGKIHHKNNTVLLVPDACQVLPLPIDLFRISLIFPSILHKVDIYCMVDDFRQDMELPGISTSTLFTAFAAPSAQEGTNYERLETLGDSFLKYAVSVDLFRRLPTADEGVLSSRRSRIVSNRNLFKKAVNRGFGSLLNVTPFNPRQWAPPGHVPWNPFKRYHYRSRQIDQDDENVSPHSSRRGMWWRMISQKMLADFMEAIVGAYYTDGGNDVALHLLNKFGLVSDVILPSGTGILNRTDAHIKDSKHDTPTNDAFSDEEDIHIDELRADTVYNSASMTPMPGKSSRLISSDEHFASLRALEQTLRYRFKDQQLLYQALTHTSYNDGHTESYQRLEFLGDAVLDWVLTRFFFNSYPHLSPATLTDLRQAAVNNESFSRMAVSLGLHRCFRHESSSLQLEIDKYVQYLGTLDDTAHPVETVHEGPKVLGDLFEAMAGAVFVDAGCDISTMWMVFRPLMMDFLDIHANPDVVSKSPIRQLHEYFQKKGFAVNDVAYRFANDQEKFMCEILIMDQLIAYAEANTKHLAKRLATFQGLDWIKRSEAHISALLERSREIRGMSAGS